MSDEENETKNLLSRLGQLIAIIMIVRYVLLIVEHYYPFLPTEGVFADIMTYVGMYAPMALMIIIGLSAVWGTRSDIIKLVFLIICAAIVIFTFFPGVRDTIVDYIGISPAANIRLM